MKPKKYYSAEQKAWCQKYLAATGFAPLMCDYEAGNMSFVEAGNNSVRWFEEWANEAHHLIENIPGADEALMRSVMDKGRPDADNGKTALIGLCDHENDATIATIRQRKAK